MLGGRLSRLRYAGHVLRALGGVHPRQCPCCGYAGRFCGALCAKYGLLRGEKVFVGTKADGRAA